MARAKNSLLRRVFSRLGRRYGVPEWKSAGPATDSLISTLLSQNTNDRNSREGFRRLKAAFPDWAAVEKAHWRKVASAIRVSGLANVKSRRIKQILRRLREERGGYSLDFLKEWDTDVAREYLLSIPGVGPKTAACVLLFSFGRPVLPVDTHIHRVARRLGLIGPRVNAEQAHAELQAISPDAWVYPLHLLMIRHGRETCHARQPACADCVLLRMCPSGPKGTMLFPRLRAE